MACHVYDGRYYKVLIIACCNMQYDDGKTQILFWENLNIGMTDDDLSKVIFKGFMTISAQTNWNAVMMIYSDSDPTLLIVVREHICFFFIGL